MVNSFDATEAASIFKSQQAFNNNTVAQHLAHIQANFSVLPSSITKLETQGLTLGQSLDILSQVVKNKMSFQKFDK